MEEEKEILMPWDKIDRSLESWQIAKEILEMRRAKKFEVITFRDMLEKTEDTTASEWWEKAVPGYGSGLWCPVYYAVQLSAGVFNSVVLLHGPQHCVTATRHFQIPYGGGAGGSFYWGHPFGFLPSTNMSERDAILGAPEKLKKAILEVDMAYRPEIIFVVPACAPGMIGEPIEEVIEDVRPDINAEIVFIDAPGFKCIDEGDMIRLVTTGYWTRLMEEPKKKDPGSVNLVGDYRTSAWGEKHGIQANFPTTADEFNKILKAMGLKLKTCLPQTSLEDIRSAPEAEFNAVTCPMFGYPIVEEMREKYGIPYSKHVFPLGLEAARNYIMAIAQHFGKEKEADKYLAEESQKIMPLWEEAKKLVQGKVALMDSAISMVSVNRQLGYGRMLKELGISDLIYFNIAPSELLGRREGVEYFLSVPVNGEAFNPKYIWWPAPHTIKLNPVEVMEFLGLGSKDVIYLYGDFSWYARAPIIDASNTPQVQSAIHFRRRRNVCQRSIFFSGMKGLLRDVINAVNAARRDGKWTLFSRILGDWPIPKVAV